MFSKRKTAALTAAGGALALTLAGCAGGAAAPSPTYDPDEDVTLDFAFWGNDVRAELYNEAIVAFNEEYPNITVNATFLAFPEFWEKRQTEAAGGGLPDVMQFDYSYLRQYSDNGLLLDLDPYLGNIIDTEPLPENVLDIGVVGGVTTGIPTSINSWSFFSNPKLLDTVGVDEFEGGTWADYSDWIIDASATAQAGGNEVWGGTDFTSRIQNFEIQLRAEDSYLFSEDGEAGFDEDRLREFWESGAELREQGSIPQQRIEEINPLGPFDAALTLAEATWDNFGAGYLKNLGEGYTELDMSAPPITVEGSKDLYLKPSMLHTISAKTKHPEASATLVNFLVNSPEVGAIFGTNRGLPASQTALEGASLNPLEEQIREYQTSIEDRLGEAPPVPIVGFGTLEEKFRQLGIELGFGTITVDDAVSQFFNEMDIVLNG